VSEDQVERAKRPYELGGVSYNDGDPVWPSRGLHMRGVFVVEFDAYDLNVIALAQSMHDPSQSNACSCAELQNPLSFAKTPQRASVFLVTRYTTPVCCSFQLRC
jgi:hypothetical protein